MKKLLAIAALIGSTNALALAHARPKEKQAPSWVTEVATRATPVYLGRVPAVVLFHERKVTVASDGTVTTTTRRAVRILTHEGKREAETVEAYEKSGAQVKQLQAWLVEPGGSVKTYDKNSVQDLGVFSDELYYDYRLRRIKAENPEIGSVFVSESEVREQSMFEQDRFAFQGELPCLESRYGITLPAGWTLSGTLLNHAP